MVDNTANMEQPSELELFLQNQQALGNSEGEGQFTLDREKALLKMADFQLPFDGAWAVKVIQSLIASEAQAPISVTQTGKVTLFRCDHRPEWTLNDVEDDFFNPEPTQDRDLNHLITALWVVGVSQNRAFQIVLPGMEYCLVWDGIKMHRTIHAPSGAFVLSISHRSQEKSHDKALTEHMLVSKRNIEVVSALQEHCFTCPVPLSIDKRRIDSLLNCPNHGWTDGNFPLTLAFVDGELSSVAWPANTFGPLPKKGTTKLKDGAGLDSLTAEALKDLPRVESSGMALLATAHAHCSWEVRQGGAVHAEWSLTKSTSYCYWINDGAVVHQDRFRVPNSVCSVGCFLSAEGLPSDLTGFQLQKHSEKDRRLNLATRLALSPLNELCNISTDSISKHNKVRYRKLGNAVLVLALGLGWTATLPGVFSGLFLGIFGVFSRFCERAEEKEILEDFRIGLEELRGNWENRAKELNR